MNRMSSTKARFLKVFLSSAAFGRFVKNVGVSAKF